MQQNNKCKKELVCLVDRLPRDVMSGQLVDTFGHNAGIESQRWLEILSMPEQLLVTIVNYAVTLAPYVATCWLSPHVCQCRCIVNTTPHCLFGFLLEVRWDEPVCGNVQRVFQDCFFVGNASLWSTGWSQDLFWCLVTNLRSPVLPLAWILVV